MDILGTHYDVTFLLSLWGAILSSILSILKLIEYWNNRFQINISPILRGDINMGHDISIQNLSSKPVLLEYMEVFTKKGKWPFQKEQCFWSPEDSFLNARIEPADVVYNFSKGDYFGRNYKPIYLRLYFVGKKPITKKI